MSDAHQKRAGWSWIKRQVDAWAEEMRHMGRHKTWHSLMGEYTDGGYTVVPLTTTTALRDEGKRMKHCVGNYDDTCMGAGFRVFSIRETSTGKSKATVALSLSKNWTLNTVRGACNSDVSYELKAVAQRLAQKYDAAWQSLMADAPAPKGTGKD